jgi:hypothetical protein
VRAWHVPVGKPDRADEGREWRTRLSPDEGHHSVLIGRREEGGDASDAHETSTMGVYRRGGAAGTARSIQY